MRMMRVTILTTLLFTLLSFYATAQGNTEDVVYLKNGSVYRGTVIELIPNESLKIQIAGGTVFNVPISDVTKVAKEAKVVDAPATGNANNTKGYSVSDSTRKSFKVRPKGYFFQGQILLENLQGGLRVVNGYKFGRFGYLGVGTGIDLTMSSPLQGSFPGSFDGGSDYLSGAYFPLYLYYAGDILNRRITPFYTVEAGYTISPAGARSPFSDGNSPRSAIHGPMGLAGFGVKFNTKRRVNFSLLLNMNFKHLNYSENYTYYDENGNYYEVSNSASELMVFPGLRFGLGF